MNIVIRKAEKLDCESIMELITELAIFEKAPHEVSVKFEHFVESGFGENPVWWAFVAEFEGKIVGFALWYIRFSTWKGQRMYLEDFYVSETMRGQGVGKLLFDKLIEEAKLKNYGGISWQVLDWNEIAINFYKKLGNVAFDGEWINCSISF